MKTVVITGIELFAKRLVEDLNRFNKNLKYPLKILFVSPYLRLNNMEILALLKADLIHFIGGNIFNSWKFLGLKALAFSKKIIIHWVGSDVLRLTKFKKKNIKNILHLCEVEWIRNELHSKGLEAEIVPLLGLDIIPVTQLKMPKTFSILTYMGRGKEVFYGLNELIYIAKKFPDIEIKIIGTECETCKDLKKQIKPFNIKFLGWVENVKDMMLSTPVFIRYVKHDGLSISVLEALSLGRHVCYNYPLQGVYYTSTLDILEQKIQELYNRFLSKSLKLNLKGIEVIKKYYNKHKVYTKILELYIELLK